MPNEKPAPPIEAQAKAAGPRKLVEMWRRDYPIEHDSDYSYRLVANAYQTAADELEDALNAADRALPASEQAAIEAEQRKSLEKRFAGRPRPSREAFEDAGVPMFNEDTPPVSGEAAAPHPSGFCPLCGQAERLHVEGERGDVRCPTAGKPWAEYCERHGDDEYEAAAPRAEADAHALPTRVSREVALELLLRRVLEFVEYDPDNRIGEQADELIGPLRREPRCGDANGVFRCTRARGHEGVHWDSDYKTGGKIGWREATRGTGGEHGDD
jgi:hypothetical protein